MIDKIYVVLVLVFALGYFAGHWVATSLWNFDNDIDEDNNKGNLMGN